MHKLNMRHVLTLSSRFIWHARVRGGLLEYVQSSSTASSIRLPLASESDASVVDDWRNDFKTSRRSDKLSQYDNDQLDGCCRTGTGTGGCQITTDKITLTDMRSHPSSRSGPTTTAKPTSFIQACSQPYSVEARRGFANHGSSSNSGQRDGKFAPLQLRAPRSLEPSPLIVGPSQLPSPTLPDLKMADPDLGDSQQERAWETWAGRGM